MFNSNWIEKLVPVATGSAVFALAPVASAALVAHYALDDGSGTTAADSSGNGLNATISNATWASDGTRSSFLTFSGDPTSFANTNIPAGVQDLSTTFTFALWTNRNVADAETNSVIFGNRYASATNVDFSPRQFIKLTPTQFEWHMNAVGDDNVDIPDVLGGVWQHHAVVKDGADVSYYLNGVLSASGTLTLALDQSQPIFFGGDGNADGTGEFFNGSIDDVYVFDNALTQEEVQALIPEPSAGLLALLGGFAFLVRRNRRG